MEVNDKKKCQLFSEEQWIAVLRIGSIIEIESGYMMTFLEHNIMRVEMTMRYKISEGKL